MSDWNWCTVVLLLIIFLLLIALIVVGTYVAMTYFKRASDGYYENDHQQLQMRQHRSVSQPIQSQSQQMAGDVRSPTNKQELSSLESRTRQQPRSAKTRATSPAAQYDNSNYQNPSPLLSQSALNYPYSALTMEQQYAIAQYWQMIYNQHMQQQLMNNHNTQ